MHLILTIIAFLIIFSVLILIHELGHFLTAKKVGIRVDEFGFGLPPRIWGKKFKKGGTLYSLNWIPFGGFVRLYGEDPREKGALKSKKSFLGKTLGQRAAVVSMGVIMNLLLAIFLLWIGYMAGIDPLIASQDDLLNAVREGTIVTEPMEEVSLEEMEVFEEPFVFLPRMAVSEVPIGSPYREAGIRSGDVILTVDGDQVFFLGDFRETVSMNSEDGRVDVRYWRENSVGEVQVMLASNQSVITYIFPGSPADAVGLQRGDQILFVGPEQISSAEEAAETIGAANQKFHMRVMRRGAILNFNVDKGEEEKIGVGLSDVVPYRNFEINLFDTGQTELVTQINKVRLPFFPAIGQAFADVKRLSILTVGLLGELGVSVVQDGAVPDTVAGPVGIAQLTGEFVSQGLLALLRFTALLSLSLAVINIFPFPGLDGGRLAFIIFEWITKKRPSPRVESTIHAIGFIVLLTLIFLITLNDIQRLIGM